MAESNAVSAPPPMAAESKPILLVVERPGPNQVIPDSSAIVIEGFAVAAAEIEEITVECADIVQSANYGLYRADLAKAYPKYPPLANSGFTCEIKREQLAHLPTEAASKGLPLRIIARDRKGQEQKFQSTLRLNPEQTKSATTNGAGTDADPTMVVQLDEGTIDKRGLLRVKGWAVSHSPVKEVSVFIDSDLIGSAELALARPDVAVVWPQFTTAANSGFLLVADVATLFAEGQKEAPKQVRVLAQTAGGVTREAKLPLQAPNSISRRKTKETHEFYCDDIQLAKSGTLSLVGWTVSSLGIDKIQVVFEGNVLGFADHGQERPDVGNKLPLIAQSRTSGFSFRGNVDPDTIKGEHVIVIESLLSDGSIRQNRVSVVATEAEPAPEGVVAQAAADDILLTIDEPEIAESKAVRLVEGTFGVSGWAIAKGGIASIELELDGQSVGSAYYGIRREDVAKAFPTYGWDNALLSGFAFSLPHRFLTEGQHRVTLKIKTKSNAEKVGSFEINVGEVGEQPGPWSLRERIPAAEMLFVEQAVAHFKHRPMFYVCVTCRREEIELLPATLRSIAGQSYPDWTIVISGETKLSAPVERMIRDRFSAIGSRIKCLPEAAEIEELNGEAKARDLVLPLDAGDVLGADALFEFAAMLNRSEKFDFIYADERRFNIGTNREDAYFKPDWSPTLLMSTNYIGRPWCATFAQLQQAERQVFRGPLPNYDTVLQLTESAGEVAHIHRVLGRRGQDNVETPEAEMRALKNALKRRRLSWTVEAGIIAETYRCRPKSKVEGLVSIVIPTCAARGLIKVCLDSLRNISTYKNFEIICIENIGDDNSEWKPWLRENCDVVVEIKDGFNWSLFNNVAAREASGEYLLFLNDDIEVIQPDWLETMLDQARDDDVGIVGPQLLYPDRKVQHAGMFLAGGGVARHAFRFCAEDDPGYFGLALTQRDVMAVTGACMLMKADTFEALGGFDEAHTVINNDLDFCLRVHERKLRCIYTPFAQLIHHELASRKDLKDEHDATGFNSRWSSLTAKGDPFFHPTLDKNNDIVQADAEPVELLFAGHPLFRKQAVKRILAVKVDHIGDFITAFPAFRRIKEHFPNAELIALVAPASKHLARLEPAIDRVVVFEFFHARSQLGRADVAEEKIETLGHELAQFKFDIAIDLRKQSDTRDLLKSARSTLTAGFDHRNEFSWLDIALTFEGDIALGHKRQHVSADLVNLVDTVAGAGMQDRSLIKRSADWSTRQVPIVSRLSESGLYKKRLVCIHPSAGNETKQWPPSYFAQLINMLAETEDVNFAVIGGPDDAKIADEVIALIADSRRVFNLVGKLRLEELSYFLDTCSLFIGNDSGPKHLAAGVGVPTIGIHSGIVDAREWGSQGEVAITAKRNMSCSPCYRASKDLCHRGLSCLSGLQPASLVGMCRNLLKLERGIQIT
jgi:ADP-heptose:LPS heptosyltransferase/GT2 family glycosyltransferase